MTSAHGRRRKNRRVDILVYQEKIASCVLFLASDDASFVTGHALVVDGGACAGTGNTEGITTTN